MVVNADVPLAKLLTGLDDPAAYRIVTGTAADGKSPITHADDVAAQVLVHLRNLIRRAVHLTHAHGPGGGGAHPKAAYALQVRSLVVEQVVSTH